MSETITPVTPNFYLWELKSRGDGSLPHEDLSWNSYVIAIRLQRMRNEINKPIKINSWYRTPAHNEEVGGSPTSMHLDARAVDIYIPGETITSMFELAVKHGFTGIGLYPDQGFIHIDDRTVPRYWITVNGVNEWSTDAHWHSAAEDTLVKLKELL